MKISFTLLLLTLATAGYCQSSPPPAPTRTASFAYDASGNRILRYIQNPDWLLKKDTLITALGQSSAADSFFVRTIDTIATTTAEEIRKMAIKAAIAVKLEVYPNPTKDVVTVSTSQTDAAFPLAVYDNAGKLIVSQVMRSGSAAINLTGLADGIYHLFVTLPDQQKLHYKITKVQ